MTVITDDLPARLLHEEHAGWKAILAGRGGEYYQREMTPDALIIGSGAMITRDKVAATFEGMAPWDSYEIREPAIIRLGKHAGIVAYRAVAKRGDEVVEFSVSTTYVFVDGGWRVAAQQHSPA